MPLTVKGHLRILNGPSPERERSQTTQVAEAAGPVGPFAGSLATSSLGAANPYAGSRLDFGGNSIRSRDCLGQWLTSKSALIRDHEL